MTRRCECSNINCAHPPFQCGGESAMFVLDTNTGEGVQLCEGCAGWVDFEVASICQAIPSMRACDVA